MYLINLLAKNFLRKKSSRGQNLLWNFFENLLGENFCQNLLGEKLLRKSSRNQEKLL